VTRRGLALSRFLLTFFGLGIAVLSAIIVMDFLLYFVNGAFLDPLLVIGSGISFLVELASFIGLMFIISHLVKSTISLITIGIVLVIVLDFLPNVVGTFGGASSISYIQQLILADFANPATFVSVVNVFLTNQVASISVPIAPAIYGVTLGSIAVAGVLWVLLPLAVFLRLATRRD